MTIATYDSIAPEYVASTLGRQPTKELEAFCQEVGSTGVILDAGCAGGRDCATFFERGFTVIGVDLSKAMLELAKLKAPGCTFYPADMRNMDFCDNNQINGIWCCASLLHLQRSEADNALKEFRRVLKADGICCIIVKQGDGERMLQYSPGKQRFFTYFQKDALRQQCVSAGFRVIQHHVSVSQHNTEPGGRPQHWIYLLLKN